MKKLLIIIVIAAGFIALIVSKQIKGGNQAVEVQLAEVEKGMIQDSILASGNLVFNTQVQLRSEVTGRVDRILVEEGQRVQQGQELMRLDTQAFTAEVTRIQAMVRASEIDIKHSETQLSNIARQLKRQKELHQAGLSQQETFDNLKNQHDLAKINIESRKEALNQAKASLSIAQDRLNKSVFLAPMTGLLAAVNIKEGETVIAGTTNIVGSDLMLVADPSAILAELRVDETDIAAIRLNQKTDIYAAAYPNKPFTGKVIQIGTSAKTQPGSQGLSFKVKVLLDQDERQLYAGMSCRAEIVTEVGGEQLKLPIEAVLMEDKQAFVWKVSDDNTIAKQNVKLALASDIEQAIESGLQQGDKVVKGPARTLNNLKSGDQIKQSEADKS